MPDLPESPGRPAPGPNNRRQLETVSRNRQIVSAVRTDAEALTLASVRGQDDARLTAGLALADAYLEEYGERDDATGTRSGAQATLREADDDARERYADLRSTLRTLYDDQPEHLERLGVARDRIADDRDVFLEEARATLVAIAEEPYATAVGLVGYPKAKLDAVAEALDALETAAGAKTSATGAHGGSTAERDAAYAAFMDWMKETRRWLELAFKDHPHVARRVGL